MQVKFEPSSNVCSSERRTSFCTEQSLASPVIELLVINTNICLHIGAGQPAGAAALPIFIGLFDIFHMLYFPASRYCRII